MQPVTSATPSTPPGWHPDPQNRAQLRWWSGAAWTQHVRQVPPAAAPSAAIVPNISQPVAQPVAPAAVQNPVAAPTPAPAVFQPTDPRTLHTPRTDTNEEIPPKYGESMLDQNSISLTAIGIAIAYLLFALTTGFALAGIVPLMVSFRAFAADEKLAPLAFVAAASAIAVAFA